MSVDPLSLSGEAASELGVKGKPLLDAVVPLLKHPERKVRFSVIDCVLVWAEADDESELASVLELMLDAEPSIRWKVMDFLSLAEIEQLRAALS